MEINEDLKIVSETVEIDESFIVGDSSDVVENEEGVKNE